MLFAGFDSIINGEVREKGLSYGIQSFLDQNKTFLKLVCFGEVEEDKACDLFKVLVGGIKLVLSGGIDPKQIEAAKHKTCGNGIQ